MFEKVLVAEDHQSQGRSVRSILQELQISEIDYAYYCDEAMIRLRKELQAGKPYELLLTDLSFDADGRKQTLTNGKALIAAAREQQPSLKVLVFSIEKKPVPIEALFQELQIDGYVKKGREDTLELQKAIEILANGGRYYPQGTRSEVRQLNKTYIFTAFDRNILKLLARGIPQKDMPGLLEQQDTGAASLSSIEKHLKQMRQAYGFNNNEQLLLFAREAGLV